MLRTVRLTNVLTDVLTDTLPPAIWFWSLLPVAPETHAVLCLPGDENSRVVREAIQQCIPVFYDVAELTEWLHAHRIQETFAGLMG